MSPVIYNNYNRTSVLTDRNIFPYPYFWRGDYRSDSPQIYDREAGFARRTASLQRQPLVGRPEGCVYYPDHCFEAAPSTKYPCYPECTCRIKTENPFLMRPNKIWLKR